MPIRIAICDDAAEDINLLKEALYSYDASLDIISYTDGQTLVDDFLESRHAINILFLDIYMPGLDGIKTTETIRRVRKDIRIIFITSSREHYSQAYEVFAFNYILKPLERERLYRILDQALDELKREANRKISISYKSKVYSVDYRDILYIESNNKFILFHKTDGETIQCYGKLDAIEKDLPSELFIRCHQSFIVNAIHIKEMGKNYFPKERYYEYLFSHMGKGVS